MTTRFCMHSMLQVWLWVNLQDGYVCQPDVAQDAWPGVVLRCVRAVSVAWGFLAALSTTALLPSCGHSRC